MAFAAGPGPVGFDLYRAGFAGGIVVEAAPAVVLGFGDEAPGYGIAVDVTNLFKIFVGGEDVEVIVAELPELFLVWGFELT